MKPWVVALIIFILLFIIHTTLRSRKPFSRTLTEIGIGLGTLLLVNTAGIFTGITLPLSVFSISVAAVAGIPGVTAMLLLNLIL